MGVDLHLQASYSGDAVLTTGYADDATVQGYGYALQDVFDIATGASLDLLIDYTTYTDINARGEVFTLPPSFSSTAGPVVVTVYRGGDYSGGDAANYSPLNTIRGPAPQVSITTGPTVTTLGTAVLRYLIGTLRRGNNTGGGTGGGGPFFIRDNEDVTLVRIDNQSGGDIQFGYSQTFFEV